MGNQDDLLDFKYLQVLNLSFIIWGHQMFLHCELG